MKKIKKVSNQAKYCELTVQMGVGSMSQDNLIIQTYQVEINPLQILIYRLSREISTQIKEKMKKKKL
jgi:hypothetical protein